MARKLIPDDVDELADDVLSGRLEATMVNGRLRVRVRQPWTSLFQFLLWTSFCLLVIGIATWICREIIAWLAAWMGRRLTALEDWSLIILTHLYAISAVWESDEEDKDSVQWSRDWKRTHWIVAGCLFAVMVLAAMNLQRVIPV